MVIDYGQMAALATSLRSAGEIAKMMVGVRDAAMIQAKVIELQGIIMSAQASALATQSNQLTLLERIRQLEKEVAEMEAWEAEKDKYQLQERREYLYVYVLKTDANNSEPFHEICATCYQHRRKSILQGRRVSEDLRILFCPECKTELELPSSLV